MPLEKVRPGQRLRIPASTWNTMIDSTRDFLSRTQASSSGPISEPLSNDIIMVRNDSGADVKRFSILGIESPIIEPNDQNSPPNPTQNTSEFNARVAVSGVAPVDKHFGAFVITVGPIASGTIGRGVISGAFMATLDVQSEAHQYADIKVGDVTALETGPVGSARILWKQPPTDRPTATPSIALSIVSIGIVGVIERWASIVCAGPNGEPNPTDESYYIQWLDWLGGDTTIPVVPDGTGNSIVLATSSAEIKTHTHSLNIGTVVRATREIDDDGQVRWVF